MLRRQLTPAVVLGTVVAALAAFSLVGGANGAAVGGSGYADERPTASAAESRPGAVEAAAPDRTERLGEVGRNDGRPQTRHQRTPEWAVTLAVATVALAALCISMARRSTGRTAVRAGRVVAARAPPLSLART